MLVPLLTEMLVTEYLTQSFELIINKFGIKLKKLEKRRARTTYLALLSALFSEILSIKYPVLMLALHTMFLSPFLTEYLVPKGLQHT